MRASQGRGAAVGRWLALVAVAVLSVVAAGCEGEPARLGEARVGYVADGQKVLFSFDDPRYDDRGKGTYTYPLIVEKVSRRRVIGRDSTGRAVGNPVEDGGTQNFALDTRTGFFDITDFRVVDAGRDVVFEVTTARPIPKFRDDASSEAKGWFLQMMDIYIDKDGKPGSGRTRTLPGRNLGFSPDDAWEKMVLLTPQVGFDVRRLIEQITWDLDFVRMKKDIVIPDTLFVEGYTFRAFVPKGVIGTPRASWGYQVLMMLFDPTNLEFGHFQEGKVQRFAGNNVFGGGDEYNGHPNVIDILAPTPEDQYSLMSAFISGPDITRNRHAVIPMMRAPKPPARVAGEDGLAAGRPDRSAPAQSARRARGRPGEGRRVTLREERDEDGGLFANAPRRGARPVRRAARASYRVERFGDAEARR